MGSIQGKRNRSPDPQDEVWGTARSPRGQTNPKCPIFDSQRVVADSTTQPYGLCEFAFQGLMHEEEVGIIYNRARYVHPLFGIFMSHDPQGYVDGMNLYEYLGSGPIGALDPQGLDYVTVSGGYAHWVIQANGWVWNTDLRSVELGRVIDGEVQLRDIYGGGSISLDAVSTAANDFWNEYDLSGQSVTEQDRVLGLLINRLRGGTSLESRGAIAQVAGAAGQGVQGAAAITGNTFTFGGTDYLNLTASTQYQGAAYTCTRIFSTVSREALITAGTLGTAQIARGGVQGVSWSARAVNYVAQSQKAVQAAQLVSKGLITVDVASGAYDVGAGAEQVMVEGDNWGYLRAGGGALRAAGGFLGASESAYVDKWSREAQCLQDQMALQAAKQGAGKLIIQDLGDARFRGMEKWQYVLTSKEGRDTVIHYVRDPRTGRLLDFKFVKHATGG